MKLYIASDHAGFELKEYLLEELRGEIPGLIDLGASSLEPEDDYPDFVLPCARAVAGEEGSLGIVIGGSGQGEAMAANRVHGARAAVFYGGREDILALSREHNDANILSLGARFLTREEALHAVRLWLSAGFSGEARHRRRIAKLDDHE